MRSISTEAKVGLFVLVALAVLAYMSFRVGEYGFGHKKGYLVTAAFDNVAGLEKDASVRIAGVEVGRIEEISLKNGRAQVTLRIHPDVELEKDVQASIKTHGILGDKYIEIAPGTEEVGYMRPGGEITRVEQQADLDRLLRELGSITSDIMAVTATLKDVVGGEEGQTNLKAIVSNTKELSENLNRVVTQNNEKINLLVTNLNRASGSMQKTFASLHEITDKINKGQGTIGQLVENREIFDNLNKTLASLNKITEKVSQGEGTIGKLVAKDDLFETLNRTAVSLQNITEKIDAGEGTIGKLVNDEETVESLNAGLKSIDRSMSGIERYISRADSFRTFFSYRGEYLMSESNAKSYVNVRIQPREDVFYVLGAVADPRGRRTVTERIADGQTVKFEEYDKGELLIDAQIGKRFRDIAMRGGFFESTGGVGVDYFALNDTLKITFEAFDFDKDRNAHLKFYADYRLFRHVSLTAGWDDFISSEGNESPFVGLSISFEDKDLKYLLSSIPISR
ncbi:MAG: MlaD family protein [Syntrophales bacterium]|jgi:phospholipid/cholesterol/gamma-HCH transport system substrate-binding protein|nr:MlaD family protein [Syntrophales bacterium]MDY0044078.1 MlaD family protein [Syntrophales bacterium]